MNNFTTVFTPTNMTGMMPKPQAHFKCVPQSTNYLFAEFIATLISLPVNLFLIVCLIAFRHKLNSQVVNIYATNVLVAITVSTIVRCVDCVWSYYGLMGPYYNSTGPEPYSPLLKLWALQKIMVVGTYIIISLAIALVILSLRAKVFRVHRTVAGVSETDQNAQAATAKPASPKKSRLKSCICWSTKNRRIYLSIALTWLVPMAFGIVEVFVETCTQQCVCVYQYVVQGDRPLTCGPFCSTIWPPVSNYYLIFGCVVWIISAVVLVVLLVRSQYDFNRVRKKMEASRIPTLHAQSRTSEQLSDFEIEQQRYDITNPYNHAGPRRSDTATARHQSFLVLESLSKQLQWMRVVSGLYIVGTGCMVGMAIYTLALNDYSPLAGKGDPVIFIFLIPTLSETVAAIVLCTKLPSLRRAVRTMLLKIFSCKVVS